MRYNDVRTVEGKPRISDFASQSGTPIVIDVNTGYASYAMGKDVMPLQVDPVTSFNQNGCGGMSIYVNHPITLNAQWTRILDYDRKTVENELGIRTDLLAGSLAPQYNSPLQVNIVFNLTFNEQQNGTQFRVRILSLPDNVEVNSVLVSVGRNAAGYTYAASFIAEVKNVGHEFVVEIGNGSTYSNTFITDAHFSMMTTKSISFIPPSTNDAWDDGFSDGWS